ncbi:MAG: tripartite tricarboxylate transporter TctB family protein [Roseovarius confluentis]|jgi:putative tricarboxylic transport membrane protein
MKETFTELAVTVGMLVGTLYLLSATQAIRLIGVPRQVDARTWPQWVLGGIALLCLLQIAQLGLRLWRARTAEGAEAISAADSRAPAQVLLTALMAALILAYFWALQIVGFAIATLAFLYCALPLLPYRNRVVKLIFPPVFTAVLIGFFSYGLSLPLPRGTGFFYSLSSYLF